ncbi:MAG: RagB/SusD family nutrient uptake outer membrane protein [Longimicrobiales bacterium]
MKARRCGWILVAALAAGCDSPLDTDPTDAIDSDNALGTARGIELALTGAYRSFQSTSLYNRNLIVHPDLYADNLDFTGTFQTDRAFSLRNVPANNGDVTGFWQRSYDGINRVNNVLAAIPKVTGLSEAQISLYRGEALFIRGLHYHSL